MPDDADFTPGDVVLDRDNDDPDPALVVNCVPGASANEWDVPGDRTVAEDNPDYPADAQVIAVVYEDDLEEHLSNWDREEPIGFTELNAANVHYYSFPAPRLIREHERSTAPETERVESVAERDGPPDDPAAQPALTDIQHVGEIRADRLRAAGYESVETIATTDQSTLADVDGIGTTRAAQITASATELVGRIDDASVADASGETEPALAESREMAGSSPPAEPSAAVVALHRYLETDGMDAEIAADKQSIHVRKASTSYRVSLDNSVEGDGSYRSQLEEAIEKVRAATQSPTE